MRRRTNYLINPQVPFFCFRKTLKVIFEIFPVLSDADIFLKLIFREMAIEEDLNFAWDVPLLWLALLWLALMWRGSLAQLEFRLLRFISQMYPRQRVKTIF